MLFHSLFALTMILFNWQVFAQQLANIDFTSDFQYIAIGKDPENAKVIIEQLIAQLPEQQSYNQQPSLLLQHYYLVHNLGYAHFKLHHKEASVKALSKSITLAKSLDSFYQAKSLHRRALSYGILFRDSDTALKDLKQALHLITDTNHLLSDGLHFDLLTALSQAYNQKADLVTAKDYILQALALVEKPSAKEDKIYALVILGRLYWQENDIDGATKAYADALKLTDANTSKGRIASIELRLAKVYFANEALEQSLHHATNAVETFTQINNKRSLINSVKLLGDIQITLANNINKAIMHYLNALDIAIEIDEKHSVGELEHLIGAAYIKENNFSQAQKYLTAAQTSLEAADEKYYSGLNYLELAKLHHANNNLDKSIELLELLLVEERLSPYPKELFVAQTLLLSYYEQAEHYQQATALLHQQLDYLQQQLQQHDANNVKKLDQDIQVKQLTSTTIELKQKLNELEYQLTKVKQHRKMLAIIVIALLVIVVSFGYWLFTLSQYAKQQKNKKHYIWAEFLSKLTQFQQLSAANTAVEHQHGLLITMPKFNCDAYDEMNRAKLNNLLDSSHQLLSDQINSFAKTSRFTETWMMLASEPTTEQLVQVAKAYDTNHLALHFIWLPLTAFPENISQDSLQLIEKLIYQVLAGIPKGDFTVSYSQLELQDSALAIVFKDKTRLEHQIAHALSTGIIRCKYQTLI